MTAPKLTKPHLALLRDLDGQGGAMMHSRMSIPGKRLATRMQVAGLVRWDGPLKAMLRITQAGRDALEGLR